MSCDINVCSYCFYQLCHNVSNVTDKSFLVSVSQFVDTDTNHSVRSKEKVHNDWSIDISFQIKQWEYYRFYFISIRKEDIINGLNII